MQFTVEIKENGAFPVLDVLVTRSLDGTLGHMVYGKPTDMELYLHTKSEHYPAQKLAVLATLV